MQRGGQGNVHREHEEDKEGFVDKIKDKVQHVIHKKE